VALPRTLILSCAGVTTTLTAAAAQEPRIEAPFFRPADHGSRSETTCRRVSAAEVSRYTELKLALAAK
jgi:hypothetical protein